VEGYQPNVPPTAEDLRLRQVLRYVLFADKYKFTPEQVDNMPAWVEARFLEVQGVLNTVRQRKMDEEIKQSQQKG
jgi:hypothetical protein